MNDNPLASFPEAAGWSLWAGSLGKGLIIAAIAFFLVAVLGWIFQARHILLPRLARIGFTVGALSMVGAMGCLVSLFVTDQFQFEYIFQHSAPDTSLPYKVASVWTAQQGSFLLWAVTSSVFALLSLRKAGVYTRWMGVAYSFFLGTLASILAYETPFNLMKEVVVHGKVLHPPFGTGMPPLLQNYWVVIHPPTIFTGFGSLVVPFAFAFAAMMSRNVVDWIRLVRPWALTSLAILGLGVAMGGLWAYETQNWGGFWGWDPVENVSFVPWLFVATFIHGIIVQSTKGRWMKANLWLGALPFIFFTYGTFLTRSGLLDNVSVHSFASMNRSALIILECFLATVIVGYTAVYFRRGKQAAIEASPSSPEDEGIQREGLYRIGILMVSLLAVVIAIGMSWPWFSALLQGGEKSRVEEALYHQVVVWFFIPVMLFMAVTPFVSWRAMGVKEIDKRVRQVLYITIGLLGFAIMALANPKHGIHSVPGDTVDFLFGIKLPLFGWMSVLIFLCMFVAVANTWRAVEMFKRSKGSIGGFIAHVGLATLLGGLIISKGFEQKKDVTLPQGGSVQALGYTIAYKDLDSTKLYDRNNKVLFTVTTPDGDTFEARPALFYVHEGDEDKPTVWPHIERQWSHDMYLSVSPPEVNVWKDPIELKVGERKEIPAFDMVVTYLESTMEGEPGTPSAKFGAKLKFEWQGKEYFAHPTLQMGEGQLRPDFPDALPGTKVALLQKNPADKAATLQLFYSPPQFPITLFYKPMTCLVWFGTLILFLGGLISAWSRRLRKAAPEPAKVEEAEHATEIHAPVPVA